MKLSRQAIQRIEIMKGRVSAVVHGYKTPICTRTGIPK